MEAVSALQHAHVIWTHVLMADDAGIFNVQLQLAHRVKPEQMVVLPWHALSKMRDWTYGLFWYGSLGLRFLPDRRRRSTPSCGILILLRGQKQTDCCPRHADHKRVTSGVCPAVLFNCWSPTHLILQDQMRHTSNHFLQRHAAQGSTAGRKELLNTFLQT